MAKPRGDDEEKPKKLSTYTVKLDGEQMEALRRILAARGWEQAVVAYARFAYKGPTCNVTAYESGKGDFFGPVVAATVIADRAAIEAWIAAGVKDSKKVAESQIIKLDKLIRETHGVAVAVCLCGMPKYNLIMGRPYANLNKLLAWQHATALVQALGRKKAPRGLLDQFTKQPLVQKELKKMGVTDFDLQMRTKAEEDPVVAAASVVARAEFVRQMHALSREFGAPLQKGAGPLVKAQAHQIIERFGARALGTFAKLHFRTAYEVVKAAGKLDELPLPEPREKMEWGG